MKRVLFVSISALLATGRAFAGSPVLSVDVSVDAGRIVRTYNRTLLIGSNIALWDRQDRFDDPVIKGWFRELAPAFVRLPGGSWSDITYWNGNGVRERGTQNTDKTRYSAKPYSEWSAPWGTWNIDYADYAPSFVVNEKNQAAGWHGGVDVKYMHNWARELGARQFAIVNGGLGSPRDAAEWVRWAGKMGYDVKYWEVGNELGGGWESGHFLPGGKELNGYIYARRYKEFATAMKSADPLARVGIMDWVDDVLAYCGELVDFVSIHTYPVLGTEDDAALFAITGNVAKDLTAVRASITKYQPARASAIDIGYTEWNMGWADLRGALWHAIWIGETFRQGATYSMQWDFFHMIEPDPKVLKRRSIYWAHWLWRNKMGDTLLESRASGADPVTFYSTKTDKGLAIMMANRSADSEVTVNVSLAGFTPASRGTAVRLTSREYLWLGENAAGHNSSSGEGIRRDYQPSEEPLRTAATFPVMLPPQSLTVVEVPPAGATEMSLPAAPKPGKVALSIYLPSEVFADTPVDGWVIADRADNHEPYPVPLADAVLKVTGPAKAVSTTVRMREAAGRFRLVPSRPGQVTVKASVAGVSASRTITIKSAAPRPLVFWEMEETSPPSNIRSQWKLTMDQSIRANHGVAKVDFQDENPGVVKKQEFLHIDGLPGPDKLPNRGNVRGVVVDLALSPDFKCDDKDAYVEAVMQGPMNWWMVLGSAKLRDMTDWKTHTFVTKDPKNLKAMSAVGTVMLVIRSQSPIHGSIYIDRMGVMVR